MSFDETNIDPENDGFIEKVRKQYMEKYKEREYIEQFLAKMQEENTIKDIHKEYLRKRRNRILVFVYLFLIFIFSVTTIKIYIDNHNDNNKSAAGNQQSTGINISKRQVVEFGILSPIDRHGVNKILKEAALLFDSCDTTHVFIHTADGEEEFLFQRDKKDEFLKKLDKKLRDCRDADFSRYKYILHLIFEKYKHNRKQKSFVFLIGNEPTETGRLIDFDSWGKGEYPYIYLFLKPEDFQTVVKNTIQDVFNFKTIR